jgi:hypothetical protein
MKPQTAKQHNAPQVGESELRETPVQKFESMMKSLGFKFVDCTPPPNFTAKVMRRIRAVKGETKCKSTRQKKQKSSATI